MDYLPRPKKITTSFANKTMQDTYYSERLGAVRNGGYLASGRSLVGEAERGLTRSEQKTAHFKRIQERERDQGSANFPAQLSNQWIVPSAIPVSNCCRAGRSSSRLEQQFEMVRQWKCRS